MVNWDQFLPRVSRAVVFSEMTFAPMFFVGARRRVFAPMLFCDCRMKRVSGAAREPIAMSAGRRD